MIATSDPLENRRKVAMVAAKAWAKEAVAAAEREAGHLQPLDKLDADIALEFAREKKEDGGTAG